MNKKMSGGLALTLLAAVLAVASIVTYTRVMFTMPAVYALLALAVLANIGAVVMRLMRGFMSWLNVLVVVSAVLTASAVSWSALVMVNQLGYVAAGLDPVNTVMSYIVFIVIAVITLVVNLIASFMGLGSSHKA
ncbi:hypothetical protein [Alloscardovia omnicolens]|uniref:hypothetical protein n=1 Tax=Alloscardovia omnicolens TaxID=419015 RepID=UPI003A665DD0